MLLGQQLASFRETHKIHAPRKSRASFLYSVDEAKKISLEDVVELGLQSLDALTETHPHLGAYRPLFSGQAREFLSLDAAKERSEQIDNFLLALSPFFESRNGQNCVEAMLTVQNVHIHNIDGLMQLALPYHQSAAFVRLVQTLVIPSSSLWFFLKHIQKSLVAPSRSVLTHMMCKDSSLFAFVCQTMTKVLKQEDLGGPQKQLISFFASISVEYLAKASDVEGPLRMVLPTIFTALRRTHVVDLRDQCLLVLCEAMIQVPSWDVQVLHRVLTAVCKQPCPETLPFLCFVLQLHRIDRLPDKVLLYLKQFPNLEDALSGELSWQNLVRAYGVTLSHEGSDIVEEIKKARSPTYAIAFVEGCLRVSTEKLPEVLRHTHETFPVAFGSFQGRWSGDKRAFKDLPMRVQALQDPNWEVRLRALEETQKGQESECALLVNDAHPTVRLKALSMKRIWEEINAVEASDLLSTLLNNTLAEVDADAILALDKPLTILVDSLRGSSQDVVANALDAFLIVYQRDIPAELKNVMGSFIGPFVSLARTVDHKEISRAAKAYPEMPVPTLTHLALPITRVEHGHARLVALGPLGGLASVASVCHRPEASHLLAHVWTKRRLQAPGKGLIDILQHAAAQESKEARLVALDSPRDFLLAAKAIGQNTAELLEIAMLQQGWTRSVVHALMFLKPLATHVQQKWVLPLLNRLTHSQRAVRKGALDLLEELIASAKKSETTIKTTFPEDFLRRLIRHKSALLEDASFLASAITDAKPSAQDTLWFAATFAESNESVQAIAESIVQLLPAVPFVEGTVGRELGEKMARILCEKVNHVRDKKLLNRYFAEGFSPDATTDIDQDVFDLVEKQSEVLRACITVGAMPDLVMSSKVVETLVPVLCAVNVSAPLANGLTAAVRRCRLDDAKLLPMLLKETHQRAMSVHEVYPGLMSNVIAIAVLAERLSGQNVPDIADAPRMLKDLLIHLHVSSSVFLGHAIRAFAAFKSLGANVITECVAIFKKTKPVIDSVLLPPLCAHKERLAPSARDISVLLHGVLTHCESITDEGIAVLAEGHLAPTTFSVIVVFGKEHAQTLLSSVELEERLDALAVCSEKFSDLIARTFQPSRAPKTTDRLPFDADVFAVADALLSLISTTLVREGLPSSSDATSRLLMSLLTIEDMISKRNIDADLPKAVRKFRVGLTTNVVGVRSSILKTLFTLRPAIGFQTFAHCLEAEYSDIMLNAFNDAIFHCTLAPEVVGEKRPKNAVDFPASDFNSVIVKLCEGLECKTDLTLQAIWKLLGHLAQGAARVPDAFSQIVPAICENVAKPSLECFHTLCSTLTAKQLLRHVNTIFPALKSAVQDNVDGAVLALNAAVQTLGSFMTPFVDDFLELCLLKEEEDLDAAVNIGIQRLGHQNALPSLLRRLKNHRSKMGVPDAQRIAAFLCSMFEVAQEDLSPYQPQVMECFGILMEVPARHVSQESYSKSVGPFTPQPLPSFDNSLSLLETLIGRAFGQFALRLPVETLNKVFDAVLRVVRSGHDVLLGVNVEQASVTVEATALCSMWWSIWRSLVCVAQEAVAKPFWPRVDKDAISCLQMCKKRGTGASKKRKRVPLEPWEEVYFPHLSIHVLQAVAESLEAPKKPVFSKELLASFVEPVVDLIDVITPDLQVAIQDTLIALVTMTMEEAQRKGVMLNLMHKAQKPNPKVRLAAVQICERIWSRCGNEVIAGLSDVMLFVAELLEDQDQEVEDATRALIRTIEEETGESLQSLLKS